MKQEALWLAVTCAAASCGQTLTRGSEVLDQSFVGLGGSVSGLEDFAQTFIVGMPGTLSSVEVELFGNSPVTLGLRRTTSTGYPTSSDVPSELLASVVLTPPDTRFDFVRADFLPFGISVHPGDVLALALRGTGVHNWKLSLDAEATYAGGEAFLRADSGWERFPDAFPSFWQADFHFRTYVVPEPSAGILLVIGGLGLGVGCRRGERARRESP